MSYHLIVVHEFGTYAKGQRISAPDEVALVLASPQHPNVVKIADSSLVEPEPRSDFGLEVK